MSSLSGERHLHGFVTQPEDSHYELRVEQKLHYPTWRLFCLQGQSEVTQPSIYCTLIQNGTGERAKRHCVALQRNLKAQERINSKCNAFHLPN